MSFHDKAKYEEVYCDFLHFTGDTANQYLPVIAWNHIKHDYGL